MYGSISNFDLAVVAVYLLGVVLLGIWIGRGPQRLADYFLGGRDLPWWALLGSVVATETSTATFLSVPGIAFAAGGDFRFLQLALGLIAGRCLVAVLLLPPYFRGELYTAYEVLERRFGGGVKQAASLLFLVTRNVGDGLRLYLAAIVLQEMVGVPLPWCVALIGATTIVYTVLGGMRSVVWNDCLQFVVYMIGGVAAAAVIVRSLDGGWEGLTAFAATNDKFRMFDWTWDFTRSETFWAGLFGGMFLTLGTHGVDQLMVQRYLCARTQRDAGRAVILSGFVVFLQFALFLFVGVGLAAFYAEQPPPETLEPDRAFAAFIVNHLPIGLVGVTLASVFAAAMSTLSSSLNSSSASALNDLYLPLRRSPPDEADGLVGLSRRLTIAFGLLQIGIGLAAQRFASSVVMDVLAVAGFSGGVLLGVFYLGSFVPRSTSRSALWGMLGGLAAVSAVKFGTDIAWPWYAVIGCLATCSVGWVVAFLWPATELEPAEAEAEPEIS